ncbi:hypothetical protein LG311_10145 [Sutcliffiella horikoshii]|uniref:hypothetical protein n=1 Tax=Sutcliffiella horikoshii TaxID=79883 RepID=UPI003850D92C
MWRNKKVEVLDFRSFMNRQTITTRRTPPTLALSISPIAMLDPIALCAAGAVLGFVMLEKYLASSNLDHLAELINDFLRFACPTAFFIALVYFLVSNPFMAWGW